MQKQLKQYLIIGIGSIIAGVGINSFGIPHHLLSGGISGIAMILYFLFGWPIGVMIALFNIPLFIMAYRLLDKNYVIAALYGILVFVVAVDSTSFLATWNIIDDTMLASIFGGVIAGSGMGLIFRVNGSTGGTDIVATILRKYYAFNIGLISFSINFIIMIAAAFLFGAKLAMYTLISMFISASLTDKIIEGLNRKKTVIIISIHSDEIAEAILQDVDRGLTFLQGEGGYTHQNKQIIFVVVTLTQIAKIKLIVEKIDPKAFMIVQDAAEVMGKGFTL